MIDYVALLDVTHLECLFMASAEITDKDRRSLFSLLGYLDAFDNVK